MAIDVRTLEVVGEDAGIADLVAREYDRTGGVFRLAPAWVGRPGIIVPGRRIKLADIYMSQEVAVNERWLASATPADNGAYNRLCPEDHGLSYLVVGEKRIQLRRALEVCGELLLGGADRAWDVLPKFFDNRGRIPNHLHPCQDHVREGLTGKPESYHFPIELNVNPNDFPATPYGVDPCFDDDQIRSYLRAYFQGDNRCTDLSRTINLVPGTGWFTPACTLHAPGSLVTYELQAASDVTCIPESRVDDMVMPPDLLDRDLPVSTNQDGREAVVEYILSMLRCPHSGNAENPRSEYFRPPTLVREEAAGSQWFVIYRTGKASEPENPDIYSAKRTRVRSGDRFEVSEPAAFGAIVLGGHGAVRVAGKEPVPVESASIYANRRQLGGDEIFVAAGAAANLEVSCRSYEDLSFYQHFASGAHPEAGSIPIPVFDCFEGK